MERLDSILAIIGVALCFLFIYIWNKTASSSEEKVQPGTWIVFYFINLIFYAIKDGILHQEGALRLDHISAITEPSLGYGFFFIFAKIFLDKRSLSVQLMFMFLVSGILFPGLKIFISNSAGWDGGAYHISLAALVWVGIVFLPSREEEKNTDRKFGILDWFSWIFGLLHISFLQPSILSLDRMDIVISFIGSFWSMGVGGVTAWSVYKLIGRQENEEWYVILGIWAGYAAYSSLPPNTNTWSVFILSHLAAIIPAIFFPFINDLTKNSSLSILLGGAGWGGLLGYLSSPLMDGMNPLNYDHLRFVGGKFYFVLVILMAVSLVSLVGVGLGIVLDKINQTKA